MFFSGRKRQPYWVLNCWKKEEEGKCEHYGFKLSFCTSAVGWCSTFSILSIWISTQIQKQICCVSMPKCDCIMECGTAISICMCALVFSVLQAQFVVWINFLVQNFNLLIHLDFNFSFDFGIECIYRWDRSVLHIGWSTHLCIQCVLWKQHSVKLLNHPFGWKRKHKSEYLSVQFDAVFDELHG